MDSLLIVLVVIGVVMILAGVARMRSKRRYGWDDIDHSVLFSKSEHDADAATISTSSFETDTAEDVSRREPELSENENELDHLVLDQEGSAVISKPRVVGDSVDNKKDLAEQTPLTPAPSATTNRARSILKKLRGEEPEAVAAVNTNSDTEQKNVYKTGAPDKVIVINVMAQQGEFFKGPALVDAIQASGIRYGDMQIFHHSANGVSLFSLVNMVKPGVFDLDSLDEVVTPGVSLFIQMPNAQSDGLAAFDIMLTTAQQLAKRLRGELRDETRSVLTHSAIDHIRQQVAEYDCKWLATA